MCTYKTIFKTEIILDNVIMVIVQQLIFNCRKHQYTSVYIENGSSNAVTVLEGSDFSGNFGGNLTSILSANKGLEMWCFSIVTILYCIKGTDVIERFAN